MNVIIFVLVTAMIYTLVIKSFGYIRPQNCDDFLFGYEQAQRAFDKNPVKYKSLDKDRDRIACEALKGGE
jgi:hypothetical protein